MGLGLRKPKEWTANDMDALESRVVVLEDAFDELERSLGGGSRSDESSPDDSELRRLLIPLLTQALATRTTSPAPVTVERRTPEKESPPEVMEDDE